MLSAVVLTKNEEKNIVACLESLKWCDETIVVDDYSEDNTVKIAKEHGAQVFKHKLNDDFASQRNLGLEKAKGEWTLFVDSDERVTPELQKEILKAVKETAKSGFYIKRRDFMWGRELKHGEAGDIKLLRLAGRDAGKWTHRVHEVWNVGGQTGELNNAILHYPHQTLREFVGEIDYYSTLHAKVKFEEGERSNLLKIIFWPKAKFFQNWILKLGFLDGTAGIIVALLMSFHSYLAWSKLWLAQRQK